MVQETLKVPRITIYKSFEDEHNEVMQVRIEETLLIPYKWYLVHGLLPYGLKEAKIVKRNSGKYTFIYGNLFHYGYTHPLLTCVSEDHCTRIMSKHHESVCGSHIGGRALSLKIIRVGYYWPTMKEDCGKHVQQCEQCQRHADWHHVPTEELRLIYNPCFFHTWGIYILGPFRSGHTSNEVPHCRH